MSKLGLFAWSQLDPSANKHLASLTWRFAVERNLHSRVEISSCHTFSNISPWLGKVSTIATQASTNMEFEKCRLCYVESFQMIESSSVILIMGTLFRFPSFTSRKWFVYRSPRDSFWEEKSNMLYLFGKRCQSKLVHLIILGDMIICIILLYRVKPSRVELEICTSM